MTWLYINCESHLGTKFSIKILSESAKKAHLIHKYGLAMKPVRIENENLEFFSVVR
jgi:hypothetical protein